MRDAAFYASSLLELHELGDAAARRASWRQSVAALARASAGEGPGPLDGLNPEALARGVRVALQDGLADDLAWLAADAAGAALFELASALPPGPEQRELGRRVLARLMAADATTFVAVARRMALGQGKALDTPAMRARVALVTELPIALGVPDGPLAMAVVARRDLARHWIGAASTGSLPSRRLAARLLERAAREAARLASLGDDHRLRVFRSDAVAGAWARLLADRESLVWRHVAVARGLLARWVPELAQAMEQALAPTLSPTEWRRAAASIVAYAAVAPEQAAALVSRALSDGLLDRDPGAAGALVWGLPRAAETEREAAEEILGMVMGRAPADVAEAVVDLCAELGASPLADRAAVRALDLLAKRTRDGGDDGAEALAHEVARDLEGGAREDEPLRDRIARALDAFATTGAKEAHALAREVLAAAQGALEGLEAIGPGAGSSARRASLALLRHLDENVLERDVLIYLLSLGGGEAARSAEDLLDPLRDRLAAWILARESDASGTPSHVTLSLRRLRALVHLVDTDIGDEDVEPQRAAHLRARWLRIAGALLERFETEGPSPVRRTLTAALARALEALVRVGACDVVDALQLTARGVSRASDFATIAEAAMAPDLVHVFDRYARFAAGAESDAAGALPALEALGKDVAPDAAGRVEALRVAIARLAAALRVLASATSLRDLVPAAGAEPEAVKALESALATLAFLGLGARARFDPDRAPASTSMSPVRSLSVAVSRVLSGAEPSIGEPVLRASIAWMRAGVPRSIGDLVQPAVVRLAALPVEGVVPSRLAAPVQVAEPLPAWLPARRTLGGFYVMRPIGSGAVGSVFVVTRVEDRADPDAEKLALKVPEYSASAARSLSEAEFLAMFRDEAAALIALPQHSNLARFVTFDAGARPKPILVMELVEGVTLDRLVEARDIDAARALRVLDDVLAGLEAMHGAGLGHLDLKPSNVVLRRGEQAVLVDFGLAGRHVRPGCATGPYGAPEVWGALEGVEALPAKADVYAFGCIAFETLFGRVLFDAGSEMAQIAMHVAHDGAPPPLAEVARVPALAPLVELLFSTLRRNPADRPSASAVRRELARVAPALAKRPWPLDVP